MNSIERSQNFSKIFYRIVQLFCNIGNLINIFFSSPNFFDGTGEFEMQTEDMFVPASDCTFKITPKNANDQIYMMLSPFLFMLEPDSGNMIEG